MEGRRVLAPALAATVLLAGAVGCMGDGGGAPTDVAARRGTKAAPATQPPTRQRGARLGRPAAGDRSNPKPRRISLVGALRGDATEYDKGVFGDIAGYEDLAFVGKWRGSCPGTGVDIIDISRPAAPRKIADTGDHSDTSMEDMQATRVGDRDVLAIGLQDCGGDLREGKSGLELYDINDPADPRMLSFFDVDVFGADVGGVHELDLTATPNGHVLALLSVPDLEAATAGPLGRGGKGDFLIVDITDPANPTLAAEWGVLDAFGTPFYSRVARGGDARTQLHSARASADGTRAYLSYWDAGVIILDISDPANPAYLGRTTFAPNDEGNAHSVDEAYDGSILVQADEDVTPFGLELTSSAFRGTRPAAAAAFLPESDGKLGRETAREVVHVGRGCPAGAVSSRSPPDPYLADPAGRIALIERGACRFDEKIARAQKAGARGAIVYNSPAGGEGLVRMAGNNPATMPDRSAVQLVIPSVFIQRSTGLLLAEASAPVTARTAEAFNGWGYLRVFDISDPSHPRQLSTFATRNANNEAVARSGTWSVHNPEVAGDMVYASWYDDGVRVIDISDPSKPREIASWRGAGVPKGAPGVETWSVVPHRDLLLASDRNFGLYVLRLEAGR